MRRAIGLLFGVAVVVGLATAALADQTINLVSVSADGTVNGGVSHSAVSVNGRFVAFRSGSDLVPGYGGGTNVFVKDMQTGAVEMVGVSSNGTQANANTGNLAVDISNDGRYVLFESSADNLVPGDTNDETDVFIHDRQTGQTERVVGDEGQQPVQARDGALSGNGRYVLVIGRGLIAAEDVSLDGVFVYDRVAGTTERVAGDGLTGVAGLANPAISDDGRYVAFTTREFNSGDDIILFDRQTDTWEVANPRIGDAAPITRQPDVSLSGNGRFVAFSSPDTNYVAGDPPDTQDAFVYDSNSGTLERIPAGGGCCATTIARPEISADGRYVAFIAHNDIYGAANGYREIAVRDRQTGTTEVVSVFNDGSPANNHSGSYLDDHAISGDGRFVAFGTFENFDPNDPALLDTYLVDREGTTGPAPGGACTHDLVDIDGNTFENDICWLADEGITRGCNPPVNDRFCPNDHVTRGQMAAFLVRAFGYTDDGGGNLFVDDNGHTFERDIDRLGTAGVTRGCNPPTNDRFCPDDRVTRGQMAAFLVRAFGYTDDRGGNLFVDDNGHTFERDIDRLGTAGVTRGCNPPTNDRFCPNDFVTRGQMAAFLRRAFGG